MPCLVLTGQPCVGKTQFARALKERALRHVKHVEIVNEESVCVDRSKAECYADSQQEKSTRAALKARVDSRLKQDTLVIVDSLNYIKGYRYELYCISKASRDRHGVIWILNSGQVAKEWNEQREDRYTEEQMNELVLRFEPPDSRNRWDENLYRINMTPPGTQKSESGAAQEALQRSVYNMHSLSDAIAQQKSNKPKTKSAASSFKRAQKPSTTQQAKPTQTPNASVSEQSKSIDSQNASEEVPLVTKSLEENIDEILDSFLHDVNPLKEGTSTQQDEMADANVLHQLDHWTQQVCQVVNVAQQQIDVGLMGPLTLSLKDTTVTMKRPSRRVSASELKRLRQQYLLWVNQHPPGDMTQRGIASSFVEYLEGQIQ